MIAPKLSLLCYPPASSVVRGQGQVAGAARAEGDGFEQHDDGRVGQQEQGNEQVALAIE